jgi:hypothetical protein
VDINKDWFRQRWNFIAIALVLLIYTVTWLPERMVQQVYHDDRERSITSANNYAKLVGDYRKAIVQIIGGAFLLYTLYLTQLCAIVESVSYGFY